MPELTFEGEIREIISRKLVCLDIERIIKINTGDERVVDLAKIPADRRVKVTVEWEE